MTSAVVSGHKVLQDFADEIPSTTNVCCWHCAHTFEGRVIPCVKRYDSLRDQFHVYGVFCTWGCAKAHAIHSKRDWALETSLLAFLKKRVTGNVTGIKPAPSKYLLQKFGGSMTIEEFRGMTEDPAAPIVQTSWQRVAMFFPQVTEHPTHFQRKLPSQGVTNMLNSAIADSNVKNDSLKVKRSKPLRSSVNSLFDSMNITVK